MARAWRKIPVMQIVGLHAGFDEGPHKGLERIRIVIDAAQEHGLADDRNTAIDEGRNGAACGSREFARMVGMQRHVDGL